jgi:hypothetical protein
MRQMALRSAGAGVRRENKNAPPAAAVCTYACFEGQVHLVYDAIIFVTYSMI